MNFKGEVHPRSARRIGWLKKIIEICEICLDYGFLPHTNVGPLSKGNSSLPLEHPLLPRPSKPPHNLNRSEHFLLSLNFYLPLLTFYLPPTPHSIPLSHCTQPRTLPHSHPEVRKESFFGIFCFNLSAFYFVLFYFIFSAFCFIFCSAISNRVIIIFYYILVLKSIFFLLLFL